MGCAGYTYALKCRPEHSKRACQKKKKKGKKNSKTERSKERAADGAATTVEWPLDK